MQTTPPSASKPSATADPVRGCGPGRRSAGLAVDLLDPETGAVLAREPVQWPDLRDCEGELWLKEVLGRGRPDQVLEPGSVSAGRCPGDARPTRFRLAGRCGAEIDAQFGAGALRLVADRAAIRLVAAGVLAPHAVYQYRISWEDAGTTGPARSTPPRFRVLRREVPAALRYLSRDWPSLLASAAVMDGEHAQPGDFPVLFLGKAFEAAERLSRRGAWEEEPVETGCGLVGVLVACPATGAFGVAVVDVLDATGAEQQPFSLAFTASSWAHIQGTLARRRTKPSTALHRLVGTAHGHNFSPDPEGGRCDACPLRAACEASTTWISPADRIFMNAVFCGQPWQLALIFGRTGRGDLECSLYALREGVLCRRAYHLATDEELDHQLRDRLGLAPEGGRPCK